MKSMWHALSSTCVILYLVLHQKRFLAVINLLQCQTKNMGKQADLAVAYRIPFLLPDCKIICCQYCCAEEHTIGYSVNRKSYCRNSIYSHAIHPSLSEPLILMWYCFCQLVLLLKQVVQIITVEQWQNSGIMNYDINIAK